MTAGAAELIRRTLSGLTRAVARATYSAVMITPVAAALVGSAPAESLDGFVGQISGGWPVLSACPRRQAADWPAATCGWRSNAATRT
ncbi:MAG TPA: hypothetical protein VJ890_20960 [Vineibacter sp.]|nr:hypothetical protein [Vineibacter sp.]